MKSRQRKKSVKNMNCPCCKVSRYSMIIHTNIKGHVWYACCQECSYEYEDKKNKYIPKTYTVDDNWTIIEVN